MVNISSLQCNHKDLFRQGYSNDFLCKTGAQVVCAETFSLVNALNIFWCYLDGHYILYFPFVILIVFFIFKYTSVVVEEYVAQGIQKISDFLKFSESLSAVTLLAFANGAGDVITSLVASGSEGGISYNIGALFGAGLFVTSLVVGICIMKSKEVLIFDKRIIFRDVLMYLIAVFLTILFGIYGWITWWTSLILLGLYIVLVIIVIVDDSINAQQTNSYQELENSNSLASNTDNKLAKIGVAKKNNKFTSLVKTVSLQIKLGQFFEKKAEFLKKQREQKHNEEAQGCLHTVSHYLDLPFVMILKITALPVVKEQYSKIRCVIYPIPGLLFAWYIIHPEIDTTFLFYPLPAGILLTILFAVILPQGDEYPSWNIILTIGGVIAGLMWSYLMIECLIDLLDSIGIILNLQKAYLGLTILAIGNALPDALTTIALSAEGFGVLAISGGIAGQLFGYLVGFGISMLKLTLLTGDDQEFNIFQLSKLKSNILEILVIGVIIIVLLLIFFYGLIMQFKMGKPLGYMLFIIYGLFFSASTAFAIYLAIGNF